ncbi:uncharacterized protein LOC119079975 [Bradysia coprophila]|uniref:uncharacterized protein LOC119079975 n=1 Tax=Bradysia coprophila TaxID=38358 RepID=UPI00187DD26F|nr:uncharacterized protein LOC119079975 [Bradysia coprophila]
MHRLYKMNAKRTNNLTNNNQQQIDTNGLKTILSNNAENDDPHPNIISNCINATELNLDLLPKKSKNNCRQNTDRKNVVVDRSIDRNKAREHIAEQQRKRLLEKKTAAPDVQKDEIKKRLAALHANSLKIVKKNVAKKQKDLCATLVDTTETADKARGTSETVKTATIENKLATPTRPKGCNLQTIIEAQNTEPAIDATPSKRGILRRKELFDGPPTTHSPTRLDKSFINSLLQTVKQRQSERHETVDNKPCDATPPRDDGKMELRVPQSELKSSVLSKSSSKSRSRSWDPMRSSNSSSRRSGTIRTRNDSKRSIPFWLKPTSTQTYPYNFIMAVRKKLESVTQPVLVDPPPKFPLETPLARPKNSRNLHASNFRQNLEKAEETSVAHESSKVLISMIDSIPAIKSGNRKPDEKIEVDRTRDNEIYQPSKPVSGSEELSTNFSSISLHITDRNTMSELSSIRSEQPNHTINPSKISQHFDAVSDGDDTTISSAILSQHSPEKRSRPRNFVAVPLSTNGIKDLKICSSNASSTPHRTKETSQFHPFVNTLRGDCSINETTNNMDQRSMMEMFETFSKNLSQVISVNERLHTALSTSVRNPDPSVQKSDVSEMKTLLQFDGSDSPQQQQQRQQQTDSEPIYTTSFEATNEESINEIEGINSQSKTQTDLSSKHNEENAETVNDHSVTQTVSEQKTGNVVVTTTIDTQTVTSQKTHILSNVPTDSVRNIDPEFRRYSTASSIIGSDIFAVFSPDDENSLQAANHSVSCDDSFNYSSIGMIDQLINTEKQKSEHLSKLMKIREKSLIDRTKGQIAWLELQKQKYKEKGLTDRISAVKKKQRALLMHMAAERSNIVRLNKLQQSPKSQRSSSKFKFHNFSAAEVNVRRPSAGNELNNISQRSAAFRAYEINGTVGLEEILRKREAELQKRRNYVEHLVQWHQRLNREEDDLLQMERMLMAYTAADKPAHSNRQFSDKSPPKSPRKVPQEMKKIKNIEKSLQMLQNMSSTSVTTNGEEIEDIVEASGKRLNKLWHRLTGEESDRFIPAQHYKLNKFDLEKMYEDAKNLVVVKFTKNKNIGPLNDLSLSASVLLQASTEQISVLQDDSNVIRMENDELSQSSVIPSLDLNFSQESKTNSVIDTNVEVTEGNDNYYFSDAKSPNASKEDKPKSPITINDEKRSTESDQDNTQADIFSLDNSLSENSFTENIDEITFPHLKDVTSLEQSILTDTSDNNNSVNDSINTIAQATSPSDAIISADNAMAKEFNDNKLSDECQLDNTTDKSLQSKNSSPDDESKSVTKSNQMLSGSEPIEQVIVESSDNASSSNEVKSIGLEQRLIDLDDSLKDLSEAIDRAPVMDVNYAEDIGTNGHRLSGDDDKNDYNEVKMVRNKNINESFPTSDMISAGKHDDLYHGSGKSTSLIRDYVSPASELKMPDIISEAEVLRRQQLNIEQEIKHLDQSVPAVVISREIPNKPPPPYVPPAHGSPMNTIHPTEERIKDIVYRRIGELYNTISDPTTVTDKSQSILSENITNIYERIILDVCKECITELDIDPSTINSNMKFKQQLAFYNPPNRLEYVQEFALKKVNKLLDPNGSCVGPATQTGGACAKRKRDVVDDMLVMEMIEDESKWSNFDLEEKEVIENIVEQIVLLVVNEAVDDAAIWRPSKTSVLKNVE